MSSFLLEQIRDNLAQIECIERTISHSLQQKQENSRESVMADHKIKNFLEQVQNLSMDALLVFNDQDGFKKDESLVLAGQKHYIMSRQNKPDVWTNFYDRLKDIKDYHRRFHPQTSNLDKYDVRKIYENAFQPPFKEPIFTGEEFVGRFVDMHNLFQEFCNLKNQKIKSNHFIFQTKLSDDYKIGDYLWFHDIPYQVKEQEYRKYKRYLHNVLSYLKSFFKRVQPLADYGVIEIQFQEDFDQRWKECSIRGWENKDAPDEDIQTNPLYCKLCQKLFQNENTFVVILLSKYSNLFIFQISVKRIFFILNHLFEVFIFYNIRYALIDNMISMISCHQYMYMQNLIHQIILVKKNLQNHFTGKKHKANEKNQSKNIAVAESDKQNDDTIKVVKHEEIDKKSLAFEECYIARLKELLADIIHDTQNQIRKKQSRTYEEMEADMMEQENSEQGDGGSVNSDSEEEEGPIYNPKNLPLGWDGKPIPYWLYKLHGLGIEYKCEICGNYSYWGSRAFERHFQEWRHSYGMKCLKIPNTVHFRDITSIEDALALHLKLVQESEHEQFRPDQEQEFEDSDGNILSTKEYQDLKRQGLL